MRVFTERVAALEIHEGRFGHAGTLFDPSSGEVIYMTDTGEKWVKRLVREAKEALEEVPDG